MTMYSVMVCGIVCYSHKTYNDALAIALVLGENAVIVEE